MRSNGFLLVVFGILAGLFLTFIIIVLVIPTASKSRPTTTTVAADDPKFKTKGKEKFDPKQT